MIVAESAEPEPSTEILPAFEITPVEAFIEPNVPTVIFAPESSIPATTIPAPAESAPFSALIVTPPEALWTCTALAAAALTVIAPVNLEVLSLISTAKAFAALTVTAFAFSPAFAPLIAWTTTFSPAVSAALAASRVTAPVIVTLSTAVSALTTTPATESVAVVAVWFKVNAFVPVPATTFATFDESTLVTIISLLPTIELPPTTKSPPVTVKTLTPAKAEASTSLANAVVVWVVIFTFSTFLKFGVAAIVVMIFAVSLSVEDWSNKVSLLEIEFLSPVNVSFLVVPTKISPAVSVNVPVSLI